MGYALLVLSAVLTVIACAVGAKVLTPWIRRRQGSADFADLSTAEWPGLVAMLLPRVPRRAWNALVLAVCVFLFGIPHHLVVWNFFRPGDADPWLYLHYVWTLAYWLALVGVSAGAFASARWSRDAS